MKCLGKLVAIVLTLGVIGGSGYAVTHTNEVRDWWFLRSYTPSAEISALAANSGFNENGRRYFYTNNPQLKDRETFRKFCTIAEQSIVLGCYINTEGIYILNITDERLSGVKEVTAAHEMLHAAYERLSKKDRERVDELTLKAYDETTNPRLRETIEAYRARDSSVVPNELHSIIGTEVRNIPAELEEYYSQYFDDRSKVVAHAERYEAVFVAEQKQIEELDIQISSLQVELENLRSSIGSQEAALMAEAERLESLRSESNVTEYNAGVDPYNASVRAYQADVDTYNKKVQTLNSLIEQYNAVANEQRSLVEAIDSRDL